MQDSVYISAGSNLGDRRLNIVNAIEYLQRNYNIEIIRTSSLYQTEPWGKKDQPCYLNCAFEIATDYDPKSLLKCLESVESTIGRVKNREKWAARKIDLDILLYGMLIFSDNELIIPHKFLILRKFMLLPLLELDSELVIPGAGTNIRQVLQECPDKGEVDVFQKDWLF